MAEKKAPQKDAKAQEAGGKKKKLIIIIAAALIVVLIGVGAGLFFFMKKDPQQEKPADPGMQVPVPDLNNRSAIGPMVDIEELIVNIIAAENNHYVKAAITLELTNEIAKEEVVRRMPQIRDSIILLMSSKNYDELQDLQGKKQLKAELASKLNAILQSGSVKSIFFTDFVVQ